MNDLDTGVDAITSAKPTHECPRHGPHTASMHVEIKDVLKRVYCMKCMVEVLDKLGIKEMEPIAKGKA